jgi:hypothetical protein
MEIGITAFSIAIKKTVSTRPPGFKSNCLEISAETIGTPILLIS